VYTGYVCKTGTSRNPVKKNVSPAKGIELDVDKDASPRKGIDLDGANIPHNFPRT
jgi:hypothetical protein